MYVVGIKRVKDINGEGILYDLGKSGYYEYLRFDTGRSFYYKGFNSIPYHFDGIDKATIFKTKDDAKKSFKDCLDTLFYNKNLYDMSTLSIRKLVSVKVEDLLI